VCSDGAHVVELAGVETVGEDGAAEGLISTCQAVEKPAFSKPMSKPPMPANRLPMVGVGHACASFAVACDDALAGGSAAFR
jgi:hypothetical protein